MSYEARITSTNNNIGVNNNSNVNSNASEVIKEDVSIFTNDQKTEETIKEPEDLEKAFKEVEDKQGFIGKAWNWFKNQTGLGLSSNKVKEKIQDYKDGKVSYDEAYKTIESYENKQASITETASNVASGTAVAIGILGSGVTGGASLALGAAIGGTVKTGVKLADRATNNVEGDDFNGKEMLKDALVGSIDGVITAGTAGISKIGRTAATAAGQAAAKEGTKAAVKTAVKEGVIKGSITGATNGLIAGGLSGAANYAINTAFDENKEFNFNEMASFVGQNALSGMAFGAAIGGINGGATALSESGCTIGNTTSKSVKLKSGALNFARDNTKFAYTYQGDGGVSSS